MSIVNNAGIKPRNQRLTRQVTGLPAGRGLGEEVWYWVHQECPHNLALITILAQASASETASWCFNGIPRNEQTLGKFAGRRFHVLRASRTVHWNGSIGGCKSAAWQHASKTDRSKDALCAARNSTPLSLSTRYGHNSRNVGSLATCFHEIPWRYVNTKVRRGGRMRKCDRSMIWLFNTLTSPTEQALSGQ